MNSVLRSTVVVVGTVISFAVAAQNANPVGDWALVSMNFVNADTGEVTRPWGANPIGQLTYSANGRMIAVLTSDPKDRKPVAPAGEKATEERAALYASSSAYSEWHLDRGGDHGDTQGRCSCQSVLGRYGSSSLRSTR